jgi:hypothetical protein
MRYVRFSALSAFQRGETRREQQHPQGALLRYPYRQRTSRNAPAPSSASIPFAYGVELLASVG